MDKGYDTGPIHDGCMDRNVSPVTALIKSPKVKLEEHKPPTCEHGEWTFAGADYKRLRDMTAMLAGAIDELRGSQDASR